MPIFAGRPVLVMIVTQIFALFIAPLILIPMAILPNRKEVMGKYLASPATNILLLGTTLFTVVIALVGIVAIIQIISGVLMEGITLLAERCVQRYFAIKRAW